MGGFTITHVVAIKVFLLFAILLFSQVFSKSVTETLNMLVFTIIG